MHRNAGVRTCTGVQFLFSFFIPFPGSVRRIISECWRNGGSERRGDEVAMKERNLRNNKTYVYKPRGRGGGSSQTTGRRRSTETSVTMATAFASKLLLALAFLSAGKHNSTV